MDKISKNISYKEATHSNTAKARKIDNTPDAYTLVRMKLVAEKCFQPVREWYGKPINVNSFYRSEKLNWAIGGAKNSQHMKGEAIDISAGSSIENEKLFNWLKDNVEFTQLINEYGFRWIHISYDPNNLKKQVFNIV